MAHKDLYSLTHLSLTVIISLPHPMMTQSSQGGASTFSQILQSSSSSQAFAHTDSSTWNSLFSSDLPSACGRLGRVQTVESFSSLCLSGPWEQAQPLCPLEYPVRVLSRDSLFSSVFPFNVWRSEYVNPIPCFIPSIQCMFVESVEKLKYCWRFHLFSLSFPFRQF